ncbi:hypothetical protein [Paracoccus sp. S1E-3]|uniref:hypothetical protein n=1 Tax=Paracoccus sp. S1E-3 TaxID=2756130 RepID=UPI0015EF32FC|nr:hypothetical protein [Paracoccus sp. S1E-3]MBA4489908.1 hypothetical protein [Paracoccus sp. S1E-3]
MFEPQAAHPNPHVGGADIGPEIGDVLASIRRLIAQEDARPDFAQPVRRLDAAGKARSTLPLGPKAEKLRSVIERELGAIDLADDRLVLRGDSRLEHADAALTDALVLDGMDRAQLADRCPDRTDAHEVTFDELGYQQARKQGLGRADGASAQITAILPHMVVAPAPATTAKDTDMMLAENSRATDLHKHAVAGHDAACIDLFAADLPKDEDQMAGAHALRNLVRDVIRQELQGEIGSRISHNLRRAIRQEVTAAIEAAMKVA